MNIELCNNLAKKKFNVYLATYCNKEIKKKNLRNIPIKNINNYKDDIRFDIIVSSNEPNIFNKFRNAKKILWMHNTLSLEKSIRKRKFLSIVRNKISVVFVSKYLRDKTSELYFFNKKFIIRNFLSNKFTIKKLNFKRKKIIVWSVQRDKGLSETIQMWIKDIYPNNKKLNFNILGINKKKYRNKEKYLNRYNIFFLGRKTKNELKNIYSKSLAMICLGYDETFCLNALEANACGLPILTFGKTALKDYSINNINSYKVNNYNDLALKINELSNKVMNKKIILNSFNITKNYRVEKVLKLWIKLLRKI